MNAIKLFVQYQAKLAEVLTGTKVYVSGGSSDKEARKNGMRANDELKILSKALHATLQNQNKELTQSKARIEQLENHIGEMGSMLKFNEMTARIRELEDAIRKFLEADMELDDKLNYGVGVEQTPNLYQAVKKAKRGLLDIMPLSEKSDKEK